MNGMLAVPWKMKRLLLTNYKCYQGELHVEKWCQSLPPGGTMDGNGGQAVSFPPYLSFSGCS